MTKQFLAAICAVAIGLSCLDAGKVFAKSPPPLPAEGSVEAVIGSSQGNERHLHSELGYLGRAGLRPHQLVPVTLRFAATAASQVVLVSPLDGGRIIAPKKDLSVSADGTVDFKFQAKGEPGLYRVLIQAGANEYRLEFYVLNTEHPEKNPPRVRIVD